MKSYGNRNDVSVLSVVAGLILVIAGCSPGGGGTPPAAPPASATLTIAKIGTGTGAITSDPAGVNCGATCTLTVSSGTVVLLTAAPDPDNTLADWGGACATASPTCAVTVTTNQTVNAMFSTSSANPTLGVILVGTGNGTVTCNGGACNPPYPWGTSITLSGVPQAGSAFTAWSGSGCTGAADCTVLLWDDTVVNAEFNAIPVIAQLSVTKNGTGAGTVTSTPAGINCGATCLKDFSGGTIVTLTASASVGSTFSGWSLGGCPGTGTCDVTLNANTSVTATFNTVPPTSLFTVTTSGTGTGSVTCNGATCNPSYPSGTALTIVATPAATSLFSGWGGACASAGTANTCNLTINANSTVSATFNLPTLSVVVAGVGTVTSNPAGINCGPTCSASFANGTAITLTASGAGFTGWIGGGCSGNGTCQVPLNTDTTVTAIFGSAGLPSFALAALEAYVKASNTGAGDCFGCSDGAGAFRGASVALAGDTLVVGAPYEASAATGVNGDQTDNSAPFSGAVYVFTRTGGVWSQQAYVKASNTGAGDRFGSRVALSGDTLAVGAYREASAATGVNGDQANNNVTFAGAVYVFTRTGVVWSQQAYLKASNTGGDYFGVSLALSGDTLAVGAYLEGSAATGVNGAQGNSPAGGSSGAVYVFTRTGVVWSQQAYVKASNTGAGDRFGSSVALAGDTLAVGAYFESSAATGVNGDQASNSAGSSGAVYVFTRTGVVWSQQAYVKASNTGAGDQFGFSVALAGDTLAVGAFLEDSPATGVNGEQTNASIGNSGAVYVFTRTGEVWSQQAYVKASNTGAIDNFGVSVVLAGDTLAVGAFLENSAATGINGSQSDGLTTGDSGAVYVFTRTGEVWSQQAYVKASNTGLLDQFGFSLALDGDTLAVGAEGEDSGATGVNGNQADNSAGQSGAVYIYRAK